MIKLRLASFKDHNGDKEIEILPGEKLDSAITRVFEGTEIKEKISDVFQVAVNGNLIHGDMWAFTALKETDTVLVALKIKGNNGQLSQLFVLAAVLLVAPMLIPTGMGAFGVGLINMGVAMIAGYAANQMFPPPVIGNGVDPGVPAQGSQMYSISSQANVTRKFGTVPKVYGRHKMFPIVAANPYVELEPDPNTGELVMYLYAIYDFGLGPVTVEEMKIGNTLITNFTDVEYNLVDPNKPAVNEGEWDQTTQNSFTIYKGDISTDSANVTLDGNQNVGGTPLSDYQVIRNAATNAALLSQEITVNLSNPQGLYAYNSGGTQGSRTINVEVYFAQVGTETWHPYNDMAQVESFRQVGNTSTYNDLGCTAWPAAVDPVADTTIWQVSKTESPPRVASYDSDGYTTMEGILYRGLPTGSTSIILNSATTTLLVGDYLKSEGTRFAQIASITNYSGNYKTYTFVSPTTFPVTTYIYDYRHYQISAEEFNLRPAPTIYKEVIALGKLRIVSDRNDPLYSTVRFTPRVPASYKVRITRTSTTSDFTYQTADSLTLTGINTRTDSDPIRTTKRHTFLEIRIKATGQLNGSIQNLSAICTSVLDTWNGSAWVKAITNNPAWVFADLLTGEVARRPLAKTRLDINSLVEWADYCDTVPSGGGAHTYTEKRFGCNFILDYDTTLQECLAQVSSASQASLNIIDGKYGVLLDILRSTPVQIFTPRNSSNFSSSRSYTEKPHGLKVTFIDPGSEWQPSEQVVYDNGYTALTATEFQDITSFACINLEQAFRFGRYFLAQNRLRQETISIKTDFEHMICTRGDYVQVTQDSMLAGGTPARVVTAVGPTITIDEALEIDGMLTYSYVFRSTETGGISTNLVGSFTNSTTIVLTGSPVPQVGDLIVIGEASTVVFDCLVKSITPESDLSATLVLVEKADGVYGYENVNNLTVYSPNLSLTVNAQYSPPAEVNNLIVEANSYNILTASYEYYIDLDWEPPTNATVEQYEIYVDFGKGLNLHASTRDSLYRYIVSEANIGRLHTFKILAVSASGKKLAPGEVGSVSATPLSKTSRPSNVSLFFSDITDQVLQLTWVKIADLDCREYIVRYSPDTLGTWETSTLLTKASGNSNTVAVQARTGAYSIKAFDFNGNESLSAVYIVTTIPQLSGLNVIDYLTDFPTLTGAMSNVNKTYFTGHLTLNASAIDANGAEIYYSEGYYYLTSILDLQDIYPVRLQSKIVAGGHSSGDIIGNWPVLSEVDAMETITTADWDVELQYRSTETFNSMADWVTMSSIATLAEGVVVNWTPWRKFLISDATGRIFQFRIKLISNKPNVTPRVYSATISADMPDRLESFNNLTVPTGGYVVNYATSFGGSFMGPGTSPNVQVTIENGAAQDRPSITSKTLTGFNIVILDSVGNPVERVVDISIKGYGKKASEVI